MARTTTLILVTIVAGAVAAGGMSPEFAAWPNGPVGWLLTDAERGTYGQLASDKEAAHFIEEFWRSRDPDLKSPVNELRLDFLQRVAAADLQFAEGDTRGALTDRGRALILLGAPLERRLVPLVSYLEHLYHRTPSDGVHAGMGGIGIDNQNRIPTHGHGVAVTDLTRDVAADAKFMEGADPDGLTMRGGVRFDLDSGVAELWRFAGSDLAASIGTEEIVEIVTVPFLDCLGTGVFQLRSDLRGALVDEQVLARAAESFITQSKDTHTR